MIRSNELPKNSGSGAPPKHPTSYIKAQSAGRSSVPTVTAVIASVSPLMKRVCYKWLQKKSVKKCEGLEYLS